jgi:hypothetical protein
MRTVRQLAEALWRPSSQTGTASPQSLTPEMVRAAEESLGVKLPESYIQFLHVQNGGALDTPEIVAMDSAEFDIREMPGIGTPNGIDSETGSKYMVEEWGYPTPTVWLAGDGHTAILLDYREVGPGGEPPVVYVDTEAEPMRIVRLAPNFLSFLVRMVDERWDNQAN